MTPNALPHNADAENAVIGGILLRGEQALCEVLSILGEDDFYQPRAQAVFRAMILVDERNTPIDVITLEAQLRRTGELELVGGIEGISRFDKHAVAHNITAHAEIVAEAAQVRNLVVASRAIAEEGAGEIEDTAAFLESSESRISAIGEKRQRGGPTHVRDDIGEVFEDITQRQREAGGVTGIATGFIALDEMTAGLQPIDLIILAARPSMGKTAAALNIACNSAISSPPDVRRILKAAVDKFSGDCQAAYRHLVNHPDPRERVAKRSPVCIFSMEMSKGQLIERALCSLAGVDAQDVRKGVRLMEQDYRALIAAADRLARFSDLFIDDSPALSITEIRSRLRTWYRKNCPDIDGSGKNRGMGMIDYLQLAHGTKATRGNREQEIGEISRGLKAVAKELKIPIVALAQLNRNVDARADHRPMLSDLRESGAIEQDADVIMFIYREEVYLKGDAPEDKRREVENKAEFIIGKQRNGPIGTVHLHFIKRYTRFENPAAEYDYGA